MKVIGDVDKQKTGRWLNNLAANSNQPIREGDQVMIRFRRIRTLQKKVLLPVHFSVYRRWVLFAVDQV